MNIKNGRKVVAAAGTALPLAATVGTYAKRLIITPLHTNTGTVAVGSSTALATAGAESGWLGVKDVSPLVLEDIDLSQVYVDATVNGEGISYVYEN